MYSLRPKVFNYNIFRMCIFFLELLVYIIPELCMPSGCDRTLGRFKHPVISHVNDQSDLPVNVIPADVLFTLAGKILAQYCYSNTMGFLSPIIAEIHPKFHLPSLWLILDVQCKSLVNIVNI